MTTADRLRCITGMLASLAFACHTLAGDPVTQANGEAASAMSDQPVNFSLQVMPLLAEHCLLCHGHDEQAAGLRLDRLDELANLVVPGQPEASELLQRLVTDDAHLRMPAEAEPLDASDIDTIGRWIEQGAERPAGAGHWAFAPLRQPNLPQLEAADWAAGPIDLFVLQQLQAREMTPRTPANRQTLIRRLSLDLRGLPPEPQEIDRFLADESHDAYERLVERMLASPHYGERWAQRWLDLTRYGDTDGYDYDRLRPAWPYREWVIAALNRDLAYDRFVIEQLAGDLLPEAGDNQRIATGFIRNSPVPQYRFDAMVDRVATTGTVFLGLSLECAQCHNHKFDPVSQEEFYRLMAVFNQADDKTIQVRSPISGERTEAIVVQQRKEPVRTFVALGGSFLDPGPEVSGGTLSELHPADQGESFDRLDLARWLAAAENPLAARVAVNRQWEVFFGRGLVATSEDLGTRTARPSHPELLDWLAADFQQSGWSLKRLHRTIVTSNTYRQSSARSDQQQRADPDNVWLGRGGRFRLDAELVRDVSLVAADALDRRLGGRSVFPYQPPGISENRHRGSMKWTPSEGADRFRRGLYTFWKRAALYPSFAIFDAPRREDSCPRRGRSNSPLQALVTLNDPAFVEAAVLLGQRMWATDPQAVSPAGWIEAGFRCCTSRFPEAAERQRLLGFFHAQRQRFADDPDAARRLLAAASTDAVQRSPVDDGDAESPGHLADQAACAMVANVLLSLDETITRP